MNRALMVVTAALISAGASRTASAQLPIPSVSIVGGVAQFDISGTGTGPIGAIRAHLPLAMLVVEGSLGALHAKEDNGTRTYVIPEGQLQWQILPFLVKPYLGVGGGWFRRLSGDPGGPNAVTLSASAGVRLGIPLVGFGVQGELRVRGIGTGFGASTAEWTLGVSW